MRGRVPCHVSEVFLSRKPDPVHLDVNPATSNLLRKGTLSNVAYIMFYFTRDTMKSVCKEQNEKGLGNS